MARRIAKATMFRFLCKISVTVLLTYSASSQAAICGLYRIEDVRDGLIYSISDLHSHPLRQFHYTISNFRSSIVQQMVNNMCYCVEGDVIPDPEWPDDESFKFITINSVLVGPSPSPSCYPAP